MKPYIAEYINNLLQKRYDLKQNKTADESTPLKSGMQEGKTLSLKLAETTLKVNA